MPLALHHRSVVADTHNDLLIAVTARPPHRWAEFFRERWLPQLRDGGVDVQVLPVFIGDQFRPDGALRETLRILGGNVLDLFRKELGRPVRGPEWLTDAVRPGTRS